MGVVRPHQTDDNKRGKPLKLSKKVAPLVAALNEQQAGNSKGGLHELSEQERLQRKNKKKAN